MTCWKRAEWRSICIRHDAIERKYGKGNFDGAGDNIVAEPRSLSDYPEQCRCRFNEDCSRDNPYFHMFIFEVEGADKHFL